MSDDQLCVECLRKLEYQPIIQYLIDHPEVFVLRSALEKHPNFNPKRLSGRRMSSDEKVAGAILATLMAFELDEGFLRAAKLEGCDPFLCHVCEGPAGVGRLMAFAQVESEETTINGKTELAVCHAECCGKKAMPLSEWRRKYAQEA